MRWILFAIAFGFPFALFANDGVPAGKSKTGREIALDVMVNAPRAEVFQMWTTEEGVAKFFGLSAVIENKVDGKYFVYFDPEDRRQSSEGAKILRYEPPDFLSFEWRGKPEMLEMNMEPFPTWVEVEFKPVDVGDSKTKVILHHYGFGKGGTWDEAYVFFEHAWDQVLKNLTKLFP